MTKFDIIDLADILLAHQLQVTTNFLNIVDSRLSPRDHSYIYSILVEDKVSVEDARKLLYSKLSEKELNCVKLLNGENAKIITIIN